MRCPGRFRFSKTRPTAVKGYENEATISLCELCGDDFDAHLSPEEVMALPDNVRPESED